MADVKNLIKGYKRFRKKYFGANDALYRELAESGQSPKTLVIACSDSRVDPSIVMDAEPGDIFVIRNVANLVPPYEVNESGLHGVSAALEFAVCVLKVEHVVVLGHSNCAGISTLIDPTLIMGTDFISKWVNIAASAREKALARAKSGDKHSAQHACEQEAIQLSLANLMTFPWIKHRVEKGALELHGWHFDIHNGGLQHYNPGKGRFEGIDRKVG